MPCILNAANEIVNRAFLEDRCGFLQMSDIIEKTMAKVAFDANPDYDVYVATDNEASLMLTSNSNKEDSMVAKVSIIEIYARADAAGRVGLICLLK